MDGRTGKAGTASLVGVASERLTHSLQPVHGALTVGVDTVVHMGRMLLLATLTAAMLAVPVALSADTPGDGTLSVKRGRGTITLMFTGTVIGRISGKIKVKDFKPLDGVEPKLVGCKPRVRHPLFGVSVCQGRGVSFRILDGRYRVQVRGVGIFLSAVGHGNVTVDGNGDLGVNDGVMSLNDQPYESLPDFPTTLPLEAPQPGG